MKELSSLPNKLLRRQKGNTLMELLIALCLVQIVLSLAYSIYLFGIKGYLQDTSSIENQSNVRIALDHITYNIRRTKKVRILNDYFVVGDEDYRLKGDNVLMNKDNQLAVGISEFTFSIPNPSLAYVKITSVPDKKGETFSLEAYFYLMD